MARNNGKPKLLPPILKRIKKQSVTLIDSSENEEMSDDQDMITAKADNRNHCGKNSRDNSSISSSSSSSDSTYYSSDYSTDESVTDKRCSKMKTVAVKRKILVPKNCSRREKRECIASDLKRTSRSFSEDDKSLPHKRRKKEKKRKRKKARRRKRRAYSSSSSDQADNHDDEEYEKYLKFKSKALDEEKVENLIRNWMHLLIKLFQLDWCMNCGTVQVFGEDDVSK